MQPHRKPDPNARFYQSYPPSLPISTPSALAAVAAQTGAQPELGFGSEYMKMKAHTQSEVLANAAIGAAACQSNTIGNTIVRGPIIQGRDPYPPLEIPRAAATVVAADTKPKYKKRTKKYNNFNIFFMLERQLLLQSRGGGINAIETPIDISESPLVKYTPLKLPPLCHRYSQLPLTGNWFLELLVHQKKKRPHRKSHGLIPFKELAQTVAKHYREIDEDTQRFVNEVAERLGWHCEELEVAEQKEERLLSQESRAKLAQGAVSRSMMLPKNHVNGMSRHVASMLDSKAALSVMGKSVYASKKRKDAPTVSIVGRDAGLNQPPLSQDEAATINHLMGLKSNSPPESHRVDTESDRLRFELAQAMNSRLESEQRIRLLQEQVAVHNMVTSDPRAYPRSTPPSSLRHLPEGYEQYLSALDSKANTSHDEREFHHPDSQDGFERKLLKEAVLQRLLTRKVSRPPVGNLEAFGYPMDALRPRGVSLDYSHQARLAEEKARSASLQHLKQDHKATIDKAAMTAPFKKRVKYSENIEEESKIEEKRSGYAVNFKPDPPNSTSTASDVAADNQLGIYNDLYIKLAASVSEARDATARERDLTLMDPLLSRARGMSPVTTHRDTTFVDNLATGLPSHGAPRPRLQAHLVAAGHHKLYAAAAAGLHKQSSYDAFVSHLAAGGTARHGRPSSTATPPVNLTPHLTFPSSRGCASLSPPKQRYELVESTRKSQAGLNYTDIAAGVWRDMNRKKGDEPGDIDSKPMEKESTG